MPELLARELNAKAGRKTAGRFGGPGPLPQSRGERGARAGGGTGGATILEQVTKAKQQAETDAILAALNSTRWNRKQAAALLNIDYKALLYKMKKLGIDDTPAPFAPATGKRQGHAAVPPAATKLQELFE